MNSELRFELSKGDFPLLTKSQLHLLDEVHDALETEIDSHMVTSRNIQNDMLELQISRIDKHLKTVMKHLKIGGAAKLRFTETYPKWSRNRKDCVVRLKEIADSLNTDRFNCNVSKMVGYCASFVGGGITLASAILIPFTMGLTTPLAIAGGTITAAGCSTAIGTSIAEVTLLKKKVDSAKKLIEEDKIYFEEMKDWLNNASELQKSLSAVSKTLTDILGIDIMRDMWNDTQKFVERAIKIQNDSQRWIFIKNKLTLIIKKFVSQMELIQVPVTTLTTIIIVLMIVFLLLCNRENRLIFDCSSLTIRSIIGIASLMDNAMDVFHLSSLFAGNAAVSRAFARAVTRGAVASIGMALDVIGIVLTSVDLHKGSFSAEARKINEAAENLREEADVLKRVYESLFHPDVLISNV